MIKTYVLRVNYQAVATVDVDTSTTSVGDVMDAFCKQFKILRSTLSIQLVDKVSFKVDGDEIKFEPNTLNITTYSYR